MLRVHHAKPLAGEPNGNPERLKDVLTHEMYHVLQDAHNCNAPLQWFREASAKWAEIHYEPKNFAAAELSGWFEEFQETTPRSIPEIWKSGLAYADFTWPLFMSQEGANLPSVAGRRRRQYRKRGDDGDRQLFPFAEHLPTFGLRDLQIPYDEEGSSQLAPEFQTAETDGVPLPSTQPTSYTNHNLNTPETLVGTDDEERSSLYYQPGNLSVTYKTINLPSSKEEVAKVKLDFSGLPAGVKAEALVKPSEGGEYEHREMPGGVLEFCREKSDEDFDQVIVVLSNSTLEHAKFDTAEYHYKTAAECASAGLSGTLNLTAESKANPEVSIHGQVNANFKDELEGDVEESTFTFDGTASGSRPYINEALEEVTETYQGSFSGIEGTPLVVSKNGSQVEVLVILTGAGPVSVQNGQEGEGAACESAGGEVGLDFIAGPYVINVPPESGPQTIQIHNTEPYGFQFGSGFGCAQPEMTTTWSGSLTWTPPPES